MAGRSPRGRRGLGDRLPEAVVEKCTYRIGRDVGSRWVTDERDLLFRTTIGTAMDGGSVTHHLQTLLERIGLPRQRFHDLRHACPTLLLARNVTPRWSWRSWATARSASP